MSCQPTVTSLMKSEPLQECSNCCEPLLIEGQDFHENSSTSFYELARGEQVIKISSVLEDIFKWSYLRILYGTSDEGLWEDAPLCWNCLNVLTQLDQIFEDFARVRKLESYISRKIQGLDEIIRKSLSCVEETEANDYLKNFDNSEVLPGCSQSVEIKKEHFEDHGDLEYQQSTVVISQGPWVVLERLKSNEIPCANPIQTGLVGTVGSPESNEDSFEDHVGFPNTGDHSEDDTLQAESFEGELGASGHFQIKIQPTKKSLKRGKKRRKNEPRCFEPKKAKLKTSMARRKVDKSKKSSLDKVKPYKKTPSDEDATAGLYPYAGGLEAFYRRKFVHPFPCVYCELDFDTECGRTEHLQQTHCERKPVVCGPCGRVFYSEGCRKVHEPKCGEPPRYFHLPPYICKDCGKEFTTWASLSRHRLVHNNDRPFACDECKYTAKYRNLITVHKKKKHACVEIFQCTQCSQKLKGKPSFSEHIKRMHTEEGYQKYQQQLQKNAVKAREKNRQKRVGLTSFCSQCNIDFETVDRFISHNSRTHATDRNHLCEQCGKGFNRSDILKCHIKICHTEERPYVCEQCGGRYKTKNILSFHIRRSHTEIGRMKYNEYNRSKYWKNKKMKYVSPVEKNNSQSQASISETSSPFDGI